MKIDRIKALFTALNSKVTGTRGGWVQGHCLYGPWRHGGKDNHPSFGIKQGTDKHPQSYYKCQSCGKGGDLTDLILDLQMYLQKDPVEGYDLAGAMQLIAQENEELELSTATIPDYEGASEEDEVVFPEEWLDSFHSIFKHPEAVDYCHGRGITDSLLKSMDVRFDPMQKRVCFPFRDRQGRLMGLQGRSLQENPTLRYFQYGYNGKRNGAVWLGENTVDLDSPVIMTEGPVDAASIMRVYPNVVASFTSGLSLRKLARLKDVQEIITFYDYGKGGDAARESIRKYYKKAFVVDVIPTQEEDDAGGLCEGAVRKYLQDLVVLV